MNNYLEQHRAAHELRERIENAMVRELLHKRTTVRDNINSDFRVKCLLDRYVDTTDKIKDMYIDSKGVRKAEIASISTGNEFVEFYNRLKQIRDFHKDHSDDVALPLSDEFTKLDLNREYETVLIEFTDEEGYGKYLDLNEQFNLFLNSKCVVDVTALDYMTFLKTFTKFEEIPREKKFSGTFQQYLASLMNYLEDYIARAKPLIPLPEFTAQLKEDFDKAWSEGNVAGWPKEVISALSNAGAPLDLESFETLEQLTALGLDRLKSALLALGLKCGGSLQERADRLWKVRGKNSNEIDPKLFAKKKLEPHRDPEKQKLVAFDEFKVRKFAEILNDQCQMTIENVQRKQARTAGEREESDDEMEEDESDEDENSDVIYNPKNLPLGWDGKPIPYWLYKLHGLNISFTCEICGNILYKGPKAFQKHFAEWRHAHGMRCLGIPNTAHFANITKIEDALGLWEKLKQEKQQQKFQSKNEEEFEDSMGNVVSKKTYEDLKRQGLL